MYKQTLLSEFLLDFTVGKKLISLFLFNKNNDIFKINNMKNNLRSDLKTIIKFSIKESRLDPTRPVIDLKNPNKCKNCGTVLKPRANFCHVCRTKVSEEQKAEIAKAAAAAPAPAAAAPAAAAPAPAAPAAAAAKTVSSDAGIESAAKQKIKDYVKGLVARGQEPEDAEIEKLENQQEEAAVQRILNQYKYEGEFRNFAEKVMRKAIKSDDPNFHVLLQPDFILIGPKGVLYAKEEGARKITKNGFTPALGAEILGGKSNVTQTNPQQSPISKNASEKNIQPNAAATAPEINFNDMASAAKKILTGYDISTSLKRRMSQSKLNQYIKDEELTDAELDDTSGIKNFRTKAKALKILEQYIKNKSFNKY